MFELTGQTALVTGAATGIGEAIAQRLTAAGARVAVADIDLDEANAAAKRIGGGAFAVCLDVTRTEHATAAIENGSTILITLARVAVAFCSRSCS